MAAYAATVTKTTISEAGSTFLVVTVAEANAAAASEYSIPLGYQVVELVKYKSTLGAGAGATIQPEIGTATGWSTSTNDHEAKQAAAAAVVNDATQRPIYLPTAALFVRSCVDAGADNAIDSLWIFRVGVR
jgi:hypothetical protein